MAIAAQPVGLNFRSTDEQVHGAAHVQNVLPCETFSLDDVTQEFKSFVFAVLQPIGRVSTFTKTECIRAKNDVTLFGKGDSRVMHRIATSSRRLGLADIPLASMLVPYTNGRSRIGGGDSIRNQQHRRDTIAGFGLEV